VTVTTLKAAFAVQLIALASKPVLLLVVWVHDKHVGGEAVVR
jgi:hypothetical protein